MTRTPSRPSSAPRSGPSPTKASRPRAEALERVGEPDDVLALDQRADADEGGALAVPAELAPGVGGVAGRERLEVDPAVGDLELRPRRRDPAASRSASQREFAITRGGAADHRAGRGGHPGIRPRLATSWPWAMTTSGARAASDAAAPAAPAGKRMCAKTTSGRRRRAAATESRVRPRVLGPRAAAAVDRDHLDLVAEPLELAHDRDEEAAQVGIGRTGPHLGHEQDPHRGRIIVAAAGAT